MTACRAKESLLPTADADNVFIFFINENVITNSKKSRVSGGQWLCGLGRGFAK